MNVSDLDDALLAATYEKAKEQGEICQATENACGDELVRRANLRDAEARVAELKAAQNKTAKAAQ